MYGRLVDQRAEVADAVEGNDVAVVGRAFLDPSYIDQLALIVDTFDVPVICYGLRTDFRSELFAASKRLMELADRIEEVPTVCWCGRRAHFNARFVDGKIVRDGEQFMLGANESYTSLCRKHYMEGRLRADD